MERGEVFKTGHGWSLVRLEDGRVAFCHYKQRDYRWLDNPEIGDTVCGVPEKTERGWRLRDWYVYVPPAPEPSAEEKRVRAEIDVLERQLNELTPYTGYPSEFEAWASKRERSGLIPICPQCGAEVRPHIELLDHTTWGGRAYWSETWQWQVSCSCGWQEQFQTVNKRDTAWDPGSSDGYIPGAWRVTESGSVKGKPSLQWHVRHEERINELCAKLDQLRAELRKILGWGG